MTTIPRLNLDENSQKFDEKLRKTPSGKNGLKFGKDSQKFSQNPHISENSQKFRAGHEKLERSQTFSNDFQDHISWESDPEQNSRKIEKDEHSKKSGTNSTNFTWNSRKSTKEYKPENFQSDMPLEVWHGDEKTGMDGKVKEEAALTIQRFYRGYKTRMEEGYSAVQKALDERRAVMERQKKVLALVPV